MKKITTVLLCTICLIFPFTFILSGCNEEPHAPQITINQIYNSIKNAEPPIVNEIEPTKIEYNMSINNYLLQWQRNFERNNIDTTDFMTMDIYEYWFNYKYFYVYIFKFSNINAASNCLENFDFTQHHDGKEYTSKQYGNLVVAVSNELSEYIFNIINNIGTN